MPIGSQGPLLQRKEQMARGKKRGGKKRGLPRFHRRGKEFYSENRECFHQPRVFERVLREKNFMNNI